MKSVFVVEKVRKAFQDALAPVELIRAKPFGIDLELIKEFEGRSWERLATDVEFLLRHVDFAFFTPEAFKYFLPAYMIGTLLTPEAFQESLVLNNILVHLDLHEMSGDDHECRDELLGILSADQKLAVKDWLEWQLHTSEEQNLEESGGSFRDPRLEKALRQWKLVLS